MNKFFLLLICFVLVFFSCFAVAPSVSSSSHPNQNNWYSEDSVSLSWALSGATSYSFVLDSSSDTNPSASAVSDTSITYSNKKEGIYYFHIKGKISSNWSDVAHYKIQIDDSGPSRPANSAELPKGIVAEALNDGSIKISWNPAEDDLSGVDHYALYRSPLLYVNRGNFSSHFTVRDAVAQLVSDNISDLTYIDSDVSDGYIRHYRVLAYNKAGNIGAQSEIASVQAVKSCDVTFDFESGLNENDFFEGTIYVNGGENEGSVKRGKVVLVHPDAFEETIVDYGTRIVDEIDLNKSFKNFNEGLYYFKLSSTDIEGDDCFFEQEFFFDKKKPVPKLLNLSSEIFQETAELKISVSDAEPSSGINKVEFYADNSGYKKLGESTDSNSDVFVFSWDTLQWENGRIYLKIKAIDNAGNEGEIIEVVTVKNTLDLRRDINALYSSEEILKEKVLDLNKIYYFYEIPGAEKFDSFLALADENILISLDLFEKGIDFEKSKKHAQYAVDALNNALNGIEKSEREPLKYNYNKSELESIYSSAGLLPEFISESVENVNSMGFSRKLNINRIVDGDVTFYLASIDLTLYNGSTEEKSFILVEPVPKSFANNSSFISSDNELVFVKNDPVFYSVVSLPAEKTTVFSYFLTKTVSFEELVELSNSINEFECPPAIVSADKQISSNVFSKPFNLNEFISGIKNLVTLNGSIPLFWVLVGAGILFLLVFGFIVLVLIAVAVYFLFFKKKGKDLSSI
ncbi:MAG: hypothetical protein JW703_04170 [Candidatus Diapherotrites archaeon]|nr:hypothetical protein [Candidatus Diapherotrites archaeon]